MFVTLVLMVAKLAAGCSRLLGRGGGQALPGLIADVLDPRLIAKLAPGLRRGVVLVTGTNGKTTSTKLMAAGLTAAGENVVTNSTGSNLKRGVTSALIEAVDVLGRMKVGTVGLFEVDEASLRLVAPLISPKAIVVLNLFRDQLDRYGELDTTAALIGEGIVASQAQLYLNADDPLVASLAKYASNEAEVSFFGIEDLPAASSLGAKTATDSDRCPICHERLQFSRVFYSHIGHYGCDRGHFSRPKPTVAISELNKADLSGSDFTMVIGGRKAGVKLPLPGTYNLYNALAAASFLHGFGINISTIVDILTTSKPAFGRFERIELDGRTLYLLLIKNPAGFAQVMETFLAGRSDLRVMMAVNDLPADGRDVSWLWDVPLESLAQFKPIIVTAGIRGADMALRLHYAGIETEAADDLAQALKQLLKITAKGQTAYILTTYTAMIEIRKLLSKLTQMSEV